MSLDVYLTCDCCGSTVYDANITHNLGQMAEAAGIFNETWRPEEARVKIAADLIGPLMCGIARLKENPEEFRKYDAPNGWGKYDDFLPWLEQYLEACKKAPGARVRVSR